MFCRIYQLCHSEDEIQKVTVFADPFNSDGKKYTVLPFSWLASTSYWRGVRVSLETFFPLSTLTCTTQSRNWERHPNRFWHPLETPLLLSEDRELHCRDRPTGKVDAASKLSVKKITESTIFHCAQLCAQMTR